MGEQFKIFALVTRWISLVICKDLQLTNKCTPWEGELQVNMDCKDKQAAGIVEKLVKLVGI